MSKYVAIIGDLKNSKKIKNREEVQKQLKKVLDNVNTAFKNQIVSNFTITLGDEFQGLIKSLDSLVEIIDYIEMEFTNDIRFGIGVGEITTKINKEISIGADGPAYYNARLAITNAKESESKHRKTNSNILFKLDKESLFEEIINDYFMMLVYLKKKRNDRNNEIIFLLNKGFTQKEIGKKMKINQSSVQRMIVSSSYYQYNECVSTLKKIFEKVW